MGDYSKINNAERAGRWLGGAYRGLKGQEQRLRLWLVGFGVPVTGARLLALCLRLGILLLVLSTSVALAIIVCGFWLIGRAVARADLSYKTPEAEWRNGPSGYGMYTDDGYRIDPHVHEDL